RRCVVATQAQAVCSEQAPRPPRPRGYGRLAKGAPRFARCPDGVLLYSLRQSGRVHHLRILSRPDPETALRPDRAPGIIYPTLLPAARRPTFQGEDFPPAERPGRCRRDAVRLAGRAA